jgi:hypothetical protein
MKTLCRRLEQFVLVTVCMSIIVVGVLVNRASAESGDRFVLSAVSNSAWILNKSNGKMIFIRFQEKDELWKSNVVTIPAGFNVDQCTLMAVGSRGTSVFLTDQASGKITFYEVKKNFSVEQFQVVDAGADLK